MDITESEVVDVLTRLKVHKATGPDNLTTNALKVIGSKTKDQLKVADASNDHIKTLT